MPEIPNFDQIAAQVCKKMDDPWGHPIAGDIMESLQRAIIEQLRQVWNARGAADLAENKRLKAALASLSREHFVCEDCWYTCPLALDVNGESECCNEELLSRKVCTCGASHANAIIEDATQGNRRHTSCLTTINKEIE